MDTTQTTCVSLCTGYGGIEIGLERIIRDLRTVAYVEIEAFACANLVAKMEAGQMDAAPIWTDLKTFPYSDFHGKVDILTGGYPCQPFSTAGKRKGKEDQRHLWPYISAGIAAMRPRYCFFENVEGHISLGLRDVLEELVGLGYRATWGIFSAAEVGAPHQRKRVFILGHSKHHGLSTTQVRGGSEEASNDNEKGEKKTSQSKRASRSGVSWYIWPSRPCEEQGAWEPRRTIKPEVGGDLDGSASRVDELRLLGNGVVPAVAQIAFTALFKEFA